MDTPEPAPKNLRLTNESQSEASLEWLHQLRLKSDRFVKSRTLAFSR